VSAQSLARHRVFQVDGRRFSHDCSGFVGAALMRSGIDVFHGASELDIRGNGVRILHEFVAKYGSFDAERVRPGDLVFFANTYDRNRDGKVNDSLTHVGIVESIDEDDTLHFLHLIRGRVQRFSMNRTNPTIHHDSNGKTLNSYLRRRKRRDRDQTPYLTSQLFSGFGSLVNEMQGEMQGDLRLTSQIQSSTTERAE
jgi:peptidoglycan DL-endopeptidase CwlO